MVDEPKRNYIVSIEINYRDGDRIFLKRNVNAYSQLFERRLDIYWVETLKGLIEDIKNEVNLVHKDIEELYAV